MEKESQNPGIMEFQKTPEIVAAQDAEAASNNCTYSRKRFTPHIVGGTRHELVTFGN